MLSPEDITQTVSFNREIEGWEYSSQGTKELFSYQAEGAAGILNRLHRYKIAYLADEVGMGKTIQALAVTAKIYEEKKSARVLIIVPRKEMLNQWKSEEYPSFVAHHLKNKSIMPDIATECTELTNLHKGFMIDKALKRQVVFCKTSSFSYVNDEEIERLKEQINKFDFIIVDEAHLFRNYIDEDASKYSRRIKVAKDIFGELKSSVPVLLMSATPLHSRRGDVNRVVSLFREFCNDLDDETIMKKIMIRRLRVMSNGVNKYAYRRENSLRVRLLNSDIRNELFYAALQKQMVYSRDKSDMIQSKNLLDFLEGTEFDDVSDQKNAEFGQIIQAYKEIFGESPSNQKYDIVLQKIKESDEKALVFVRRRASGKEIVRQYIRDFDNKCWNIITGALTEEKRIKSIPLPSSREEFNKIIETYKSVPKDEKKFHYKVVDDFLDEYRRINSDRLARKRRETVRKDLILQFFNHFDKFTRENFEKFKEIARSQNEEEIDQAGIKSIILDLFKRKRGLPSTHASRFVLKFTENDQYRSFFEEFLPKLIGYDKALAELVRSAVLHASIGVVELYGIYLQTGGKYTFFKKRVEKSRDSLQFIREVKDFIAHYDKFEKYLKFNTNAVLEEDSDSTGNERVMPDENLFYNAQPAYAYLSDTKNKSVIARFNSPFFPYLLCGTSILQEGVNLHLFCNKVYHFGAAHTRGDDEQRIGRVDRVMGKMDRELKNNDDAKLDIFYPYLEGTFDETNLKKMLCEKRSVEELIDMCIQPTESYNGDSYCQISAAHKLETLLYAGTKVVKTEPYSWQLLEANIDV